MRETEILRGLNKAKMKVRSYAQGTAFVHPDLMALNSQPRPAPVDVFAQSAADQASMNPMLGDGGGGSTTSNPVLDAARNGIVGQAIGNRNLRMQQEQNFSTGSANVREDYAMGSAKLAGPGTTTSDSIPANLSAGEAVLPAKTVQAMGSHNIARLIEQTNGTPPKGLRAGGHYVVGAVPNNSYVPYSPDAMRSNGSLPPNASATPEAQVAAQRTAGQLPPKAIPEPIPAAAPAAPVAPDTSIRGKAKSLYNASKSYMGMGSEAPNAAPSPPKSFGAEVVNNMPGKGVVNATGAITKGALKFAGRLATPIAIGNEVNNVGGTILDPTKTTGQKVLAGAEGVGRLASASAGAGLGATTGALLGTPGGPLALATGAIGGVLGGAAGYFGGSKLIDKANDMLGIKDPNAGSKTLIESYKTGQAGQAGASAPAATSAPAAPPTVPVAPAAPTPEAEAAAVVGARNAQSVQDNVTRSNLDTQIGRNPNDTFVEAGNRGLKALSANPKALNTFNDIQLNNQSGVIGTRQANGHILFSGTGANSGQAAQDTGPNSDYQRGLDRTAAIEKHFADKDAAQAVQTRIDQADQEHDRAVAMMQEGQGIASRAIGSRMLRDAQSQRAQNDTMAGQRLTAETTREGNTLQANSQRYGDDAHLAGAKYTADLGYASNKVQRQIARDQLGRELGNDQAKRIESRINDAASVNGKDGKPTLDANEKNKINAQISATFGSRNIGTQDISDSLFDAFMKDRAIGKNADDPSWPERFAQTMKLQPRKTSNDVTDYEAVDATPGVMGTSIRNRLGNESYLNHLTNGGFFGGGADQTLVDEINKSVARNKKLRGEY